MRRIPCLLVDFGVPSPQELPAIMQWSFGADEAARINQPALAVLGENSIPVFRERRDLLLAWLPNVESYVLPGTTHLLQVQSPRPLAHTVGLLCPPPAC